MAAIKIKKVTLETSETSHTSPASLRPPAVAACASPRPGDNSAREWAVSRPPKPEDGSAHEPTSEAGGAPLH